MTEGDPRDGDGGDELEAEIMRTDHPFGVELRGTTLVEAQAGQSLDEALARERPDGRTIDEGSSSWTTASLTSRANWLPRVPS